MDLEAEFQRYVGLLELSGNVVAQLREISLGEAVDLLRQAYNDQLAREEAARQKAAMQVDLLNSAGKTYADFANAASKYPAQLRKALLADPLVLKAINSKTMSGSPVLWLPEVRLASSGIPGH
jgi:hypothetical protein